MIVHVRTSPETVAETVSQRVRDDVVAALQAIKTVGEEFIVNDTICYMERVQRGSSNRILRPCVMNSAEFLSHTFQVTLQDRCKWRMEETIAGQTIDNFIELPTSGTAYRVPRNDFPRFFAEIVADNPADDLPREFAGLYRKYVQVGIRDIGTIAEPQRAYFAASREEEQRSIRIGLEFETGNIASAFRALTKLEGLFVQGHIDCGVFVTCIDKPNAACRIWPASNRNGCFAELEKRRYRENLTIPLWEFGFQPDGFRDDVGYFKGDGTLYTLQHTGRKKVVGGVTYDVCTRHGSEKILVRE